MFNNLIVNLIKFLLFSDIINYKINNNLTVTNYYYLTKNKLFAVQNQF